MVRKRRVSAIYESMKTAIIIPVYNKERNLPRLLQTVLSQTCRDFIAIFVNDGSKDSSLGILNAAKSENPEFVEVISKINGGVSSARNAGLDAALRMSDVDSIIFVDSDDFIHCQTIEVARNFLKEKTIICWDFKTKDDERFLDERYDINGLSPKHTKVPTSVCCSVYPVECVRDVRFCESSPVAEDQAFNMEVEYKHPVEFEKVSAALYFYVEDAESEMHRRLKAKDMVSRLKILEYMVRIYEDDSAALRKFATGRLGELLKYFYRDLIRRVDKREFAEAKAIFVGGLKSLRSRGLLKPVRGRIKELKYYIRFLIWTTI